MRIAARAEGRYQLERREAKHSVHYCDFEHADFPEEEFALIRGQLFRHLDRTPEHTDDGALLHPREVNGPDELRNREGQD
jgi:hypothetical protein